MKSRPECGLEVQSSSVDLAAAVMNQRESSLLRKEGGRLHVCMGVQVLEMRGVAMSPSCKWLCDSRCLEIAQVDYKTQLLGSHHDQKHVVLA